ncbi:Transcriptional regulator, AraC family [Arcticibacter svalbardensis MN12-7]|uniref:Transcriptional regulator, AraC family n=1 Tax=Arcticibacter svalbardensis MN12-7 TaxID=1150600 RepID=R9GYR2_9SPHI|nr:AraC family transcriptional regulator [Arcticibacter svalbardensis]EOR96798.1 Transcriptional regulator, AraC family [Arcticibacter svalbardensis MN12-7]
MAKKMKIRDGFEGEKVIYIPEKVLKDAKEKSPELFHIYLTQIGYFPKAAFHYRAREKGCTENILIYCIQGKGHCILDNKRHEVNANQFVLLPATNKYISYWADDEDPWTIYWLHFASDQIDHVNNSLNIQITKPPVQIPLNENAISTWQNIYQTLEMGYSHENLISASFSLFYLLATFLFPERHVHNNADNSSDIITKTIQNMRNKLNIKLTVEEMATQHRLSVSHFSNLFRKTTGMSPIDYFIHLKMQKACQLLYLDRTRIKAIAMQVGYDNPYYFSRLFKNYIGISPNGYRQRSKNIG